MASLAANSPNSPPRSQVRISSPTATSPLPSQIRMSEHKDNWKPLRKIPSQPAEKYRIGEIGFPWEQKEKNEWLAQTSVKRSYMEEVVLKFDTVDKDVFRVEKYGDIGPELPLMAAISNDWDAKKPSVLVTGGVHGYETSGVQGALLFLATAAKEYTGR